MKRISPFILLIITLIFTTCDKPKECPAFDDADMALVPYNDSDTIIFSDHNGSTYSLYINSIITSGAYEKDCNDQVTESSCPCINDVQVMASGIGDSTDYVFLKIDQSDISDMQYYYYDFLGFKYEFDFVNEIDHIIEFPNIELLDSLRVNNILYNEVVTITNQDSTGSDVSMVYFTKEDGLIKYLIDTTEWQLSN